MFRNKKSKWIGVLMGTLIGICICGCGKNTVDFISSEGETEQEEPVVDSSFKEDTEEQTIWIYVCGQVEKPGVYVLPQGSRVCDAFIAAGGLNKNAAKDYWNQARVLSDGEMIYVPTVEEALERRPIQDTDKTTDEKNGKVNINTASKEELMEIPGVGESKAESIIAHRKEHGDFSSPEAIMEVSGIKEGMYEKIKDYIVVN